MFDSGKTRMIGLSYGEKTIPEHNGQMDRQTDGENCYINIVCQYSPTATIPNCLHREAFGLSSLPVVSGKLNG